MLPLDYAEEKTDEKPTEVLFTSLSVQETEALLKQARKVWKVRLLDLLQTAMGKTIAPWVGVSSLPMCVIVNGRDQIFEDIDVSCTVGSFAMGVLEVMDYRADMRPVLSPGLKRASTRRLKSFGSLNGPRMALLARPYCVSIWTYVY